MLDHKHLNKSLTPSMQPQTVEIVLTIIPWNMVLLTRSAEQP